MINKLKSILATINNPIWRIKVNLLGLIASAVLTTIFFHRQQHDMCKLMALSGTMHIVAVVLSLLEHEIDVRKKNDRS